MTAIIICLLLLCAIGYLFWQAKPKPQQASAYQQLLRRAMQDTELVERLLALERARHPQATREKLAKYALERMTRDNR